MRIWNVCLKLILIIIIGLISIALSCREQDKTRVTEKEKIAGSDVPKSRLEPQTELDANLNTLLKLIREKEYELQKTELELKRKAEELAEKETQLKELQASLKKFRRTSYLILIIGLVLIGVRLVPFFLRNKPKRNSITSTPGKPKSSL